MTTDMTDPLDAFVAALRTAEASLREVPGKLEGARVHDFAFGRMFEATEVRDAYHQRLPETEKDIAEACEVIEHFIVGLTGAHGIGANPAGPVPERSQPTDWSGRSFPWNGAIPHQSEGDQP